MGIAVFPAAGTSIASGTQTFTSSSTWTAPAGVSAVTCTVVGGGGGGGASGNSTTNSNYNFPAGGGAGGAVTTERIAVTSGTTYTVVVGAGGGRGVSTGADTSFVSASAGGFSSFALNFTLQNAILNGAAELGAGDWLQGEEPFSASITNPPAYPGGYNGTPSGAVTTTTTNRNSITNVTGAITASQTRWFNNNLSNSSYRDLILWVPVTQNTQYILSAYGASQNGGTQDARIRIDWYSSFNSGLLGNMQSSTVTLPSATTWARPSVTGTSPSGATWALIRLMSSSTQPIWTGVLLQQGSTQNDYVGPLTSSANKTINNLGIISVISGVINNGGGGGSGLRTTSRVAAPGFGGGQAGTTGGSFTMGGNGAGAGAPSNFNIIADRNSIPYVETYTTISNNGGGISSGNPAVTLNSTNGGYLLQPNGNPGLGGYGAGGMGARGGNVLAGISGPGVGPSSGVTAPGADATANTGAGGGGGMCTSSGVVNGVNGGNGGSGIVILSW